MTTQTILDSMSNIMVSRMNSIDSLRTLLRNWTNEATKGELESCAIFLCGLTEQAKLRGRDQC